MLILTRNIGESIRIGEDVAITVLRVKGTQVRLGIDAPKETLIHREEIYQRIQVDKAKVPQKNLANTLKKRVLNTLKN